MDINEDCVRRRAYRMWEAEGRPAGRYQEHWHRARSEIEDEIRRATEHMGDVDHWLPLHVDEALLPGLSARRGDLDWARDIAGAGEHEGLDGRDLTRALD